MSYRLSCLVALLCFALVLPVSAELVGYWPLDEGAGSVGADMSGNGHDAVISPPDEAVVSWAEGYSGSALSFNQAFGGDVRVDAQITPGMLNISNATLMFWMKMPAAHQAWGIIADLIGASTDYSLEATDTGAIYFYNPWYGDDSQPLNDDQWHHVALVADGGALEFVTYIDGQRAASSGGSASDDIVTVRIGGPRQYQSVWASYIGLLDEVAVFNEALDAAAIETIYLNGLGLTTPKASQPVPADGQEDVALDATLSWKPVASAQTRNVYFSTVFEDVNTAAPAALVSAGQTATNYDPGRLSLGQTYYWRVDEVNGAPDFTVFPGPVWSFTAEPVAFVIDPALVTASASSAYQPSQGPDKVADGSGLADGLHSNSSDTMWISADQPNEPAWIQFDFDQPYTLHQIQVWNCNQQLEQYLGFGFKDTRVDVSLDGQTWTTLVDSVEIARAGGLTPAAVSAVIDAQATLARSVRLTALSNWSGGLFTQYGLSEVRFTRIPTAARLPEPTDGAENVALDAELNWRPGRFAAQHEVHFGLDANAVAAGSALIATTADHSLDLAGQGLEYDRTYSWRVDEVNEAAAVTRYAGSVWSFTTLPYAVVDDFEAYDDDQNRIYSSWVDGYNDSTNGSQVGHIQSPFAEQEVVFAGDQAMPYYYDNTGGVTSRATLTLGGQDWTAGGVTTLTLFVRGRRDNTGGQLFVEIGSQRVDSTLDLSLGLWKQWNIDLTALGNLTNVSSLTIGVSGAGKGLFYVDEIRLYREAPAVVVPTDPGSAGLLAYWSLDEGSGMTVGDSVGGHDGTIEGVAQWVTGMAGGALRFSGTGDYVNLGTDAAFDITDTISLSAWVKTEDAANSEHNPFIGKGDTSYALKHGSGNSLEFFIHNDGSWHTAYAPVSASFNGEWHHVAGTFDGAVVRLYVDGLLAASADYVGPIGTNSFEVNMARNSEATDRLYQGALDEVRLYTRALSEAEVRYLAGDR